MKIKSKKIGNVTLTIAKASEWSSSQSTAFRDGVDAHKYWAAAAAVDGLIYEPTFIFKTIKELISFYTNKE